jgi:hypothetical protein
MKIFCTGNPKRKTIAHGLQELGQVTTGSISTGWNYTNPDTLAKLEKYILDFNVFVNSAWVSSSTQLELCNTVYAAWQKHNVRGHIINIGTTLENTDDNSEYAQSKRLLKSHSLELSDNTGYSGVKISYIVVGGVGSKAVTPVQIAQTIHWIVQQQIRIPLIQLDSVKT